MKEIILSKGLRAIVDDEDYDRLRKIKWHASQARRRYYARSNINGKIVYMHRFLYENIKDDKKIDHANNDGLDNRRSNLRIADASQNGANREKNKENKTGYKGVTVRKIKYKNTIYEYYVAAIGKKGTKYKYIGIFKNPVEAAKAYNNVAIKYFGEFARLNVI